MKKTITVLLLLAFTLLAAACNRQKPPETSGTDAAQSPALQSPAMPASTAEVKTGTVKETMNSAGYTYMLVEKDGVEQWIAVLEADVAVGDEISYYDGLVMQNFQSKTLDRTFDSIVFSNGLVGEQPFAHPPVPGSPGAAGGEAAKDSFAAALQAEGSGPAAADTAMSGGSQKAVVPFEEMKIDKAAGESGFTVGDVYAKKADLDGKSISVRGKVMKVSSRIMGRNWIHIQDGTGSAMENTHDLVVTTSDDTAVDGDVITVSGVLAVDRDFGSGYKYAVILEEASVSK